MSFGTETFEKKKKKHGKKIKTENKMNENKIASNGLRDAISRTGRRTVDDQSNMEDERKR